MAQDYADGDYIHDTHWLTLKRGLYGDAIITGLSPSHVSGMTTTTGTGSFSCNGGTIVIISPAANFGHSNGDPTYDRWDLIYGYSSGAGKIEGTPSITPAPPDLPAGSIVLYLVKVPAGATTLSNADIYEYSYRSPLQSHIQDSSIHFTLPIGEGSVTFLGSGGHDHSGGSAGTPVTWANISGKPSTFPPSAHASDHLVGGSDALSVGTPVAIGTANSAGSATNFARRDHVHEHGSLTGIPNAHHNRYHGLGSTSDHSSATLSALNNLISDATLDDISGHRTPLDNSVTNAKMADNAINTIEIVDGAVTYAKLASPSVSDSKIYPAGVGGYKMGTVASDTLRYTNSYTKGGTTGASWWSANRTRLNSQAGCYSVRIKWDLRSNDGTLVGGYVEYTDLNGTTRTLTTQQTTSTSYVTFTQDIPYGYGLGYDSVSTIEIRMTDYDGGGVYAGNVRVYYDWDWNKGWNTNNPP